MVLSSGIAGGTWQQYVTVPESDLVGRPPLHLIHAWRLCKCRLQCCCQLKIVLVAKARPLLALQQLTFQCIGIQEESCVLHVPCMLSNHASMTGMFVCFVHWGSHEGGLRCRQQCPRSWTMRLHARCAEGWFTQLSMHCFNCMA